MPAGWRSIANWSVLVSPAGDRLMGAFKGYFDESGKDTEAHNALAFCGYVTTIDGWMAFEAAWQQALDQNCARYLHMKELQKPDGVLGAFAGKEGETARNKLLGDLIDVIAQSELVGAGSLIRLADLREFNREFGLNIEPLPLAMYATMGELHKLFPSDNIEVVVDRLDKAEQIIATAIEYASSYVAYDPGEKISWTPLKGQDSFRNVLPIQAADFAAWEARKDNESKNGWWEANKRGLPIEKWIVDQGMWLGRQGKSWPNHRISFANLAAAKKTHAGIIDYDFIKKHHLEIRHGVWTVEARDRYWRERVLGRSS